MCLASNRAGTGKCCFLDSPVDSGDSNITNVYNRSMSLLQIWGLLSHRFLMV